MPLLSRDPAPSELEAGSGPLVARAVRGVSQVVALALLTSLVWAGGPSASAAAATTAASSSTSPQATSVPSASPATNVKQSRAKSSKAAAVPAGRARATGSQVASQATTAGAQSTAVFPPPLRPAPKSGRTAPPSEVVSARTADSALYDNHDGTYTRRISKDMNYLASPGNYQPVNLNFQAASGSVPGASFVENHSNVTVTVSPGGIATTDAHGSGLRVLTPALASVSATAATAVVAGVAWRFDPTGSGMELSAMVASPQALRTYTFPLALLGGASALTVDANGDLVSNSFQLGRPLVIGANGVPYPAGAWTLATPDIAQFSVSDVGLPAAAYPYLIDPPMTYLQAAPVGDSFLDYGSYPQYPPATEYDGSQWLLADDSTTAGSEFALNFDTSSIPASAYVSAVSLVMSVCLSTYKPSDNDSVYIDNVSGSPIGPNLYPALSGGTGPILGSPVNILPAGSSNPQACVVGQADGAQTGWSLMPHIQQAGTTTLRFRIGNQQGNWIDSPYPTGANYAYFGGYADPVNDRPYLGVSYVLPAPAPAQVSPVNKSVNTLTPTLQIGSVSDPDLDSPVQYAFAVDTQNPGTGAGLVWLSGTPQPQGSWTPGLTSVTVGTQGFSQLAWNHTYYWEACAWDGVDPVSRCSPWTAFTTVPSALATPMLQAPPANGGYATTLSPALSVGAISDPNGGSVSYDIQVWNNGAEVCHSGFTASTSYNPGCLIDGKTYSWLVVAQDSAGVQSTSATWSFTVDTPPALPSVATPVPQAPNWVTATSLPLLIPLTWSDTEPLPVGYSWAFDTISGTVPSASPVMASSVTESATGVGTWYFHIRVLNQQGTWSPPTQLEFQVASTLTCGTPGMAACTPAQSDTAGLQDFYPYQSFALGGPTTAYDNLATGNLVVQSRDLTVPGPGLNFVLQATYNADRDPATPGATDTVVAGPSAPLGPGWVLAVSEGADTSAGLSSVPSMLDVGPATTDATANTFDFYDADGTHHYFLQDSAGLWHSPPGVNLSLVSGGDLAGPYYRLVRPDGVVYEFRLVGLGYRLVSIKDRQGDVLNFNYGLSVAGFGSGQLIGVSNGAGQSLTLNWSTNAAGFSTVSSAVFSSPDGSVSVGYLYDSAGRLSSITQALGTPDAAATTFGYGGSAPGLSSVTDPANTGTTNFFESSAGQLTKLSDRAGQPWSFAYASPGCTASPDNQGSSVTCATDPSGGLDVYSITNDNMVASRDAGDTWVTGTARTNVTKYAWVGNRLMSQINPDNTTTSYAYNAIGQVTQTVNSGSGPALVTNIGYTFVTPTVGGVTLPTNTVADLTSSSSGVGTPSPRNQEFYYNTNGTLASSVDPTQVTTTYTYQPLTPVELATITDPNNNTTHYNSYDASGQPTQVTDATGTVTSYGYDVLGDQKSATVSGLNLTTKYGFDARGNRTSVTDPAGDKTLTCYDADDNAVARILPASSASTSCSSPGLTGTSGSLSVSTYDPRDLLSSTTTNSDGQIRKTTYSYYANGQLDQITEPRSFSPTTGAPVTPAQVATYNLYPDNRVKSFVDETGSQTVVSYTPGGLIAQVSDPPTSGGQQVVTSYAYNWQGDATTTTVSGHPAPTLDSYDVFGDKVSETDPNGATSTFGYDADGRMVTSTAAVTTTALGAQTTNVYDPTGNLTRLIQPTGSGDQNTVVNYTYSPLNQLQTETDPADSNHVVSFAYDAAGRQSTKTDRYNGSTLRVVTDGYDPAGRMTSQLSTGAGLTTVAAAYSYDADSNMTGVTTTDGGGSTPNVSAISIGYTSAGEAKAVNETDYTPTGTAVTKVSSAAWAQDGLVSSTTTDGLTASYGYYLNGSEASTSAPGYGTVSTSYFPDGSVSQTALPGATTKQSYDPAGRLASKVVSGPAGITLASWTGLSYDPDDRLQGGAVGLQQAGGGLSLTWNMVNNYTPQGYLSSAQGPADAAPVAFKPDNAGNMQASRAATMNYVNNQLKYETATATGIVTQFGYNHLGQQASETTGGQVTTTVYDAAGNPSVVTSPDGSKVTYAYDGLGRMVSRQDSSAGGSSELDFYGGTGSQIVETTDLSGNDADTATVHYLLDSSGSPVAQQANTPAAGSWSSYVTDPHENMTQLVSTSGSVEASYSFDVFGNQAATSTVAGWSSRLLFQMAPVDPKLGVYNLGPRLLDPTIGRFTSADNAVASTSDLALQTDSLTGDRYLYAGANPAGMIDNGYACLTIPFTHVQVGTKCHGFAKSKKSSRRRQATPTPSSQVTASPSSEPSPTGAANLPAPYSMWYPYVEQAAQKYGVPPALILATIEQESHGNNVISPDGHGHGLMQIDDRSYGSWLKVHDNGLDPQANIDEGTSIIAADLQAFPGDLRAGIDAYNAGIGGVRSAIKSYGDPDAATKSTDPLYATHTLDYYQEFLSELGGG